ncbi:uncharacterized protein LOC120908323 [Anopheles arabiensis]|uniref:uncharacterized protein LOC120908323 n=1 Tax=Anopheles arabiensis TaxID=7173 RepID=UPI001AAD7D44|nr:uncharacterized protein LOC120908323 [Anopheles arabiensis]
MEALDATPRRRNKTTSDEDRKRVITAYENGVAGKDIALMLNLHRATVYSIIKKFQKTWNVEAAKRGGNRAKLLPEEAVQSIRTWIDEDCTVTLKALAEKVHERYSVRVSTSTIARQIKGFNYTFKRIHNLPERRNTSSTIEERKSYATMFYQLSVENSNTGIVFLDEVGFNLSMRTSQGRSQKGTIPTLVVPQLRSRNISIICAMDKNGIVHYHSHNRAVNRELFKQFILQLKEKLRTRGIDESYLIMDNVAFHKCIEVKEAIGNEEDKPLYLPPYSPFLNPIENMFSKWKNLVKTTSQDCEGYFRNMTAYLARCFRGEVIED